METPKPLSFTDVLQPFADVADHYHDSEYDSFEVWVDAGPERIIRESFKLRLYRAARRLLKHIDVLFDVEPDIGASSPEPSLRTIVFAYYNAHFDREKSSQLTDAYFAALIKEPFA